MDIKAQKNKIIEIGARLYEKNMIAGCDGNISVRTDDNKILITGSGIAKGFLTENDIVMIDQKGRILSENGKPSSEYLMHLAIYTHRPDINACVHAHPPYTTALSTVNLAPPATLLPEAILTLGAIILLPYAPVGTEAVPNGLIPQLDGNSTFILKNHGVLTIGENLEIAYNRMETVEHLAKIFYIARNCGEPDHLDPEEIERLRKL